MCVCGGGGGADEMGVIQERRDGGGGVKSLFLSLDAAAAAQLQIDSHS